MKYGIEEVGITICDKELEILGSKGYGMKNPVLNTSSDVADFIYYLYNMQKKGVEGLYFISLDENHQINGIVVMNEVKSFRMFCFPQHIKSMIAIFKSKTRHFYVVHNYKHGEAKVSDADQKYAKRLSNNFPKQFVDYLIVGRVKTVNAKGESV